MFSTLLTNFISRLYIYIVYSFKLSSKIYNFCNSINSILKLPISLYEIEFLMVKKNYYFDRFILRLSKFLIFFTM